MKIVIDNKAWKGAVTVYNRLYLPQVELVESALLDTPKEKDGRVRLTDIDKPRLPALLACVEKWEIADFPEVVTLDNFPMTPRRASHAMIEQIFDAIRLVYVGELEIPNES